MKPYNMTHQKKAKREKVLNYWKRQLNKETRSKECGSSEEYIRGQIKNLEDKLKGVISV